MFLLKPFLPKVFIYCLNTTVLILKVSYTFLIFFPTPNKQINIWVPLCYITKAPFNPVAAEQVRVPLTIHDTWQLTPLHHFGSLQHLLQKAVCPRGSQQWMCEVNKPGYLNFVLEGPVDESAEVPPYILDVHFKWFSWICTWKNTIYVRFLLASLRRFICWHLYIN